MSTTQGSPNASAQTTQSGYDAQTYESLAADAAQIIARYPVARSALLPMLHLVQSQDSYISRSGIIFCSEQLNLTPAEVSAVATFYTQYKRKPNGEYTVGVCTNTLCAIMGGDEIFDELSEHLEVGQDETTEDGKITLERIECNAGCDFAPVVMVNWEFMDNQTPESATKLADDIKAGKDIKPSRGPDKICSFKQVSRVLAGFNDGLANEGPGAGKASLEGLKLAKEKNWTAPAGAPEVDQGTANQDDVAPKTGSEGSSAERPSSQGVKKNTEGQAK